MPPVYPTTDLDRPEKLLGLLGSFWSEVFTGNDLVQALQFGRGQLDAQTALDFDGLLDAMARETVRPFRRRIWHPLTLLASQLQPAGLASYGDSRDFTYSSPPQIFYGVPPTPADAAYAWLAPAALAKPGILLNRISSASLTLVPGLDFLLDTDPLGVKRLIFNSNPFNNPLVSIRPILDNNGNQIDQAALLWMYGSSFDHNDIYHQFGYVVSGQAQGDYEYRNFVNALYDGLCRGGCASDIGRLFSAAADAPLAIGNETVQVVVTDANFLWVITDQHAYRCGFGATALVAVGDVLTAGQSVCDAIQFFEFNTGQIPAGLSALAVGPGLLAPGYQSDLVFSNEIVPLIVTTDSMGFTKVSFDLGGLTDDVTLFWDNVHAAGLVAGQTLANLLDQRPLASRTTQPTAIALPATVNPLGFLISNLLRDNAFLCRVKTSSFGPDAVGLTRASQDLNVILPPQTLCITLAELAGGEDPVTLDGDSDPDTLGEIESFGSFSGGTTVDDDYNATVYGVDFSRGQQV